MQHDNIRSLISISYHCRQGMTSQPCCYSDLRVRNLSCGNFIGVKLRDNFHSSCYGNKDVTSFPVCNGMKCILCSSSCYDNKVVTSFPDCNGMKCVPCSSSCYGNKVVRSFPVCNGMKCIPSHLVAMVTKL